MCKKYPPLSRSGRPSRAAFCILGFITVAARTRCQGGVCWKGRDRPGRRSQRLGRDTVLVTARCQWPQQDTVPFLSCSEEQNFVSRARTTPLRSVVLSAWVPKPSWTCPAPPAPAARVFPVPLLGGAARRLGLCDPQRQPPCPPAHKKPQSDRPGNKNNGSL